MTQPFWVMNQIVLYYLPLFQHKVQRAPDKFFPRTWPHLSPCEQIVKYNMKMRKQGWGRRAYLVR